MRIWQQSGAWTVALAGLHLATTTVFYGDSVRSLVAGGVIGALDADPGAATLRGSAFWYVTTGLVLAMLGLMVLSQERRRGSPPAGFAALMAVTGLWGLALSPVSGFWLFLPIALLAARTRSRERRAAARARPPVWPVPTSLVETPSGPIEYVDTGGPGPALVFTPGFPMNHAQWRQVIPAMTGYRCLAPTLPLGGHRYPMRADADLSQVGQAHILADFLEALDLRRVTVVMNDWGGPQLLVSIGRADRVSRLVLASCEAFDNVPPRPARRLLLLMRVPGGTALVMQLLRLRLLRHHRLGFGALTQVGIPDAVLDEWFEPAMTDPAVRRDLRRFATGAPPRAELLARAEQLAGFTGPVLIVWGAQDAMMPLTHPPRLAGLFPDAEVVFVEGSGTLIPEDRPDQLVALLRDFLRRSDDAVTAGPRGAGALS